MEEEQQQGQLQGRNVVVEAVKCTGHVMAVEQIHLGPVHHLPVGTRCGRPDGQQSLPIQGVEGIVGIAVVPPQRFSGGPAKAAPSQPVIHHAIEVVALQPGGRITPNLANNPGLRVGRPHHLPELNPEVRRHFGRDVETPAVNPLLEPVTAHRQQMLPNPGIGMVELGQIRQGPPTVVTAVLARGGIGLQGPSVHMEPIPVRRIRTVFHHVMKGPKAAAAVVEHPIQNQPHAALMHGIDQVPECCIAPQQGIHLEIVVGVVAMVGG